MAVLIVSKTRMRGGHVCVGGLDLDRDRNVRLLDASGENQPTNTEFQIGEIWEIRYRPLSPCQPPHVEDVLVSRSKMVAVQDNLADFIANRCSVVSGPLRNTFDGCLERTGARSAFISRNGSVPGHSVCFWRTDVSLFRDDYDGKIRYQFQEGHEWRHVTFVGFQNAKPKIHRGTLVRLSLARWWKRPDEAAEEPEKCFLQLSGYYQ